MSLKYQARSEGCTLQILTLNHWDKGEYQTTFTAFAVLNEAGEWKMTDYVMLANQSPHFDYQVFAEENGRIIVQSCQADDSPAEPPILNTFLISTNGSVTRSSEPNTFCLR